MRSSSLLSLLVVPAVFLSACGRSGFDDDSFAFVQAAGSSGKAGGAAGKGGAAGGSSGAAGGGAAGAGASAGAAGVGASGGAAGKAGAGAQAGAGGAGAQGGAAGGPAGSGGAAGGPAGSGGAAGEGGQGGAQGGAAGAGGQPAICDVFVVDSVVVDVGPAQRAYAAQVQGAEQVTLYLWDPLSPGDVSAPSFTTIAPWSIWPPVIPAPAPLPLISEEGRFAVATGTAPGTTTVLVTPITDADPGPILVTADISADGSFAFVENLEGASVVGPLAIAPSSTGSKIAAFGRPPFLSKGILIAPDDTITSYGTLGCGSSSLVADVAEVGGTPWMITSTSGAFGTCLLTDGPVAPPSRVQIAALGGSGAVQVPAEWTTSPSDYATLARLVPVPDGVIAAVRFAGADAAVQPGLLVQRLDAAGNPLSPVVEILQPHQVPAAGLAAAHGNLAVAYVDALDPSGGQVAVAHYVPGAKEPYVTVTVAPEPGDFVHTVEFVQTAPDGMRWLVGFRESSPDNTSVRLRLARVSCLPFE